MTARPRAKISIDGAVPTKATPNTYTVQIAAYFSEDKLKEAMSDVIRDFENKQKIFISKRRENGKLIFLKKRFFFFGR